jgi:hypothetical protein
MKTARNALVPDGVAGRATRAWIALFEQAEFGFSIYRRTNRKPG